MLAGYDRITKQRKRARSLGVSDTITTAPYAGSLAETYAQLYPKYLHPDHLIDAGIFDLFERAKAGERVYACISLPPRAGKTETLIAAIVDRLLCNPATRAGYASSSARLAEKKSHRARALAIEHGISIDMSSRSKRDWRTGVDEGGLWATSCEGAIVGEGFELLVLDDLIPGRAAAESAIIRDATYDWIIADALTRMEPNGSVIVCGTRYHADDHIGRLVATGGFDEIVVPAISVNESGADVSYWPERWQVERLQEIREEKGGANGYDWCSLYMGTPRALGESVFRDAHLVTDVPGRPRIAIGVDFAYTVGKSSDYSAAVVLAEWMGEYFVVDVLREKIPEADFRKRVVELYRRWDAQFVVGYVAATEQPNIDMLAAEVPTIGKRAVADKKTRALPTAAGWNLGKIKVLDGRSWTKGFVGEVVGFTGSDRHDDQVDALAAVYDAMHQAGEIDWDYMDKLQLAAPQPMQCFN